MAAGSIQGASGGRRIMLMQTQAENAGAQEISRLVGDGLAARGYDVHHLFFFRRTDSADTLPNLIFCANERPNTAFGLLRLLRRLRRAVVEIRPDVVVTFQHYGNIIGTVATCTVPGIPVIANQVSPEGVTNRLIRVVDRWLGRFGAYDSITVNSQDTANAFAHHPAAYRRRISHIPHGFQDKSVALSRAEARARFGLPADGTMLGSAARLHQIKHLDAAIRLLPAEPEWRLALAGQGPERESLAALAASLGVAGRVHFLGEISSTRIGEFFAALDVFVFPSRGETFGLAPVEAAQAGVPVVASGLPVLRETLSNEGEPAALFVDVDDAGAFRAAVRRILDEPAVAAGLVRVGRSLSSRYPVSTMIDSYEGLIRGVLDRQPRGRPAVSALPDRAAP